MMMVRRVSVSVAVAMALMASCSFGQVIRLEKKVVVGRGQDVRLGNIATIKGVDEQAGTKLAEMVIVSGVDTNRKIGADSIMLAIMSQLGAGGLADQLQVSGASEVEIVVSSERPVPVVVPQAAAPHAPVAMASVQQQQMPVVLASVASSAAPAADAPKAKTLSDI